MKRWCVRALLRGSPIAETYELVRGESTIVGRAVHWSDYVVASTALSRAHARFAWRRGAWTVADHHSGNGTRVRGNRVDAPTPLAADEIVGLGFIEVALREFDAEPLDDLTPTGDWIAYGRRRPFGTGRWPAFRVRHGAIERALLLVGDAKTTTSGRAGAPPARSWRDRGFVVAEYDAADGIHLSALIDAIGDDDDALRRHARALARQGGVVDSDDVVVTWDGAVRTIPWRRVRDVGGMTLAEADALVDGGLSTERLAAMVRAEFADEWRAELELREQLANLDDDGVRWLLNRKR